MRERCRLETDVDDARGLIDSLADGPGYVFGSRAGAIVALHLLTRYPECVSTVVAHEPPLVRLLSDADHYLDLLDAVYDTLRRRGTSRAMRKFVAAVGFGPPRFGTLEFWRMARLMPRTRRNMTFGLEHEIRQYSRYQPNTAALQAVSTSLALAGGQDSRDLFPYRATTALAELLDTKLVNLPGGHVGYRAHPAEFARRLALILRRATG